jgi:hypothetical protein
MYATKLNDVRLVENDARLVEPSRDPALLQYNLPIRMWRGPPFIKDIKRISLTFWWRTGRF